MTKNTKQFLHINEKKLEKALEIKKVKCYNDRSIIYYVRIESEQ